MVSKRAEAIARAAVALAARSPAPAQAPPGPTPPIQQSRPPAPPAPAPVHPVVDLMPPTQPVDASPPPAATITTGVRRPHHGEDRAREPEPEPDAEPEPSLCEWPEFEDAPAAEDNDENIPVLQSPASPKKRKRKARGALTDPSAGRGSEDGPSVRGKRSAAATRDHGDGGKLKGNGPNAHSTLGGRD
eukprot:scaffold14739_cov107-Isochrysis_galbana.AAC.4